VSESAVKAVSLDSVIRKFTLDKNKQNVLVLELQGAETDILESVTPANLHQFFWVVIKTSELALYDNELENVALSKVMEQSAFDPVFTEELTFPFCVKMYKRNDAQLALYNAQFNIDKLESDLDSSHKSLAASNSQIEALRQEKATLESDLDSSHKSFAASNSQIEALNQEKATLESDLDSSHDSFAASNSQIEALNQEKATLESDLDSSHKSFAASSSQVEALRQEKATLQKNKSWAESLNKQCEELKVYSAERQQSADLALKLQTKAQVDLENLREKYQHKHINEQKLVALISELRAKLKQAAEYYYELQEKHPELNEITQTQVERSDIEECQTANVAELEKKTRPAKRKIRSKQAKSVTRGKS
jgi:chromosome segregation ATPase